MNSLHMPSKARVVVGSLLVVAAERLLKYRMWDGGGCEINTQPSDSVCSWLYLVYVTDEI